MNHPHPNKLHIVRTYRRFLLAEKRTHGRAHVHYVDMVKTYLTAKRQHFAAQQERP